jgi:hypothetical protein
MPLLYRCLIIIPLFSSFHSNSAIFKCVIDGVPTFSQQPCSENAQMVQIKVAPSNRKTTTTQSSELHQTSVSDYLEISSLKRQIKEHQRKIKKYKNQMDSELSVLRKKERTAANNLAGATYLSSISTEMNAVVKRYSGLISTEQKQVDRFKAQLVDSTSQQNSTNNEVSNYIARKKVEREKTEIQRKIRKYRKQMDREIAKIKHDAMYATNNIAGATYEDSLNEKMIAISEKYQTLIDLEQSKLDNL